MTAQLSVLIALLLAASCSVMANHNRPGHDLFEVLYSPWSICSRINASQGCYMTREAVCVRKSDNATAPWYYCNSTERSATVEACPDGCVQNCAVSEWGGWSPCNCSSHLFRNRSRSVISPPRNGGQPCPGMLEQSVCDCALHLPFDVQPRRYSWRTGPWGECSALEVGSGCGNGLRRRSVQCVDVDQSVVPAERCLQESAYSKLHPPSPEMLCEIPCRCILGEWGNYSSCTPLCDDRPLRGEQTRTRPILQAPTLGQSCDVVTESRTCPVTAAVCPTYAWDTSGWSPCKFQTGATCGAGHMTRYAYCIEMRDGVGRSVVEDSKCLRLADNTTKPSLFQPCQASCPQACQVGEWSDWTDCPRSCLETFSNRTRSVIVPPLEGEVCPHTTELRPCPVLPCARYLIGEIIGDCILLNRSNMCGEGSNNRHILCVDPDDQDLGTRSCSHLEYPNVAVVPCIIPCPDECVVSGWSEWSPCSETCGGRIGNQTRTRHFVAQGTSCPYTDANLTDTRACSEIEECEVTRYYIHEEPWTACAPGEEPMAASGAAPNGGMLQSDESRGSGCTGVRNKTRVCMRNGEVTPTSECPLEFQRVQFVSCELPCPAECVLSEWTPYSTCSVSCGPGTKHRSRRLLQFPTSDLSDCGVSEDDLAEDGLVIDTAACETQPCEGVGAVAWYEMAWSSCNLYTTVNSDGNVESGSCGLGFETRNVTCAEVGTGLMVSESQCYNAMGPRPSTIRDCHHQCPDRCLVTEWSEFSRCEFGGSTETRREVVPHESCSRFQECCPELSSIETTQSFPCPSFNPDCYAFFQSSNFGQCILDSPIATCGNGRRHRNFVCLDRCESRVVDASFCRVAGRQEMALTEPCSIKCERNCIQSEWGEWGPCVGTCGNATRSRMRITTKRREEGGRPCGPEVETDACVEEICPYAEVTPGTFGPCILSNSTSICGAGLRTREPLCSVNGEPRDYSACVDMGVEAVFNLDEPCVAACPGECVAGEWGAWSPCNTNTGCLAAGSCQRHRERDVLRAGDGDCMPQDIEFCRPPEILYTWVAQNWTSCVIGSLNPGGTNVATRGHYCGTGVHSRIVRCEEITSGDVVSDYLCTEAGLTRPILREHCATIPCPIDCVVGAFSDWSECETCAYNSQQRRVRPVIIANMSYGEECPDLEQTRPCVPTNCTMSHQDNHTFVATDYTSSSQCGSASTLLAVSCRSNTEFLPPAECQVRSDAPQEMQVDLPCPREPNCTFGEWSDWSECLSLCHDPGTRFSFRTRPLVSSLPGLAIACAAQQHQQMECVSDQVPQPTENGTDIMPTNSMLNCVDFSWQVSEWNQNGRSVYCLSNTGIRVEDSGCPLSIMPRSRNETCEGVACPTHATCDDEEGTCVMACNDISEKVQGVCLPRRGCFSDAHCLLPNMECNSQGACSCEEGYDITNHGYCTRVSPTITDPTDLTDVTTDPADVTGDPADVTGDPTDITVGVENPVTDSGTVPTTAIMAATTKQPVSENELGVIVLALIGAVPLLVFIILIVCLILIVYRCRKNLERNHVDSEMKRRRTKASISAPSPLPQTTEEILQRIRGDSGSSGFVEGIDADLHKYGMAATTFTGSQGDGRIDEPLSEHYSPERHRSVAIYPIPTAAPVPPSRSHSLHRDEEPHYRGESRPSSNDHSLRSSDQVPRRYQIPQLTDFPDGGVTTDMTYTTDEDTVGTTSFPPSSVGSPNMVRRPFPSHMHHGEPNYRDYSHSNNNHYRGSGHEHTIVPASQCHHDHGCHDSYDSVHDNQDSVRGNHNHVHGNHDQARDNQGSVAASSENPYVSMQRMSPVYAKVRRNRNRSASPPLSNSAGRYARHESPHRVAMHPGERDGRIAVGLDNSMLRAVNQLERNSPTSVHSSQSHSRRRSGRRRRHHMRAQRYHNDGEGHYRYNGYHYSDSHLRSDGHYSSDHYSTSDAEYPSRSEPRTPTHQMAPPGVGYESRTLPHPRVHFSDSHPHSQHHYEWQTREYYPGDGDYHRGYPQGSPTRKDPYNKWYQGEEVEGHGRDRGNYYVDYPPRTSLQRRHTSPHGHSSPQRRHASPQRHTPPPSPRDPPNFVPPVPPHAMSPVGSEFDDYDYPSRYQPHQLLKLKEEAERERNSPYARPRPLNSPGSNDQGSGRISSPYDYPKIRSAGSGASHTPPFSPGVTSDPSTSFSHSSPQISRAAQGGPLTPQGTPQNRHSNHGFPGHMETAGRMGQPQSNVLAPQTSTSAPRTNISTPLFSTHTSQPNSTASLPSTSQPGSSLGPASVSQPGSYLGFEFSDPAPLPSEQTSSASTAQRTEVTPPTSSPTPQPNEVVPQPSTSTPRRIPKANLTIQISPVSDQPADPAVQQGSPFLSRKYHPPSPLVLHSSSMSEDSPRTSSEIDALGGPRSSGDMDTLGSTTFQ